MKLHLPLSLRRAILLCIFPVLSVSEAAPTNPDIKHGDITINTNGNATTVNQASHFGIIEWDSFNLGASDTVDFNFTLGKEAFSLNRITDDNASTIMGSIRSNGNVFLVNTSGIVFGEGSSVDVAGFAASTLDISDGDFITKNFTFSQKDGVDPSFIINEGSIQAADEGFIVLMAPKIENRETASLYIAKRGTIAMGSGQKATLSFQSSGLIKFEVTEEVEKNVLRNGEDEGAGIENSGTVSANGGHVIMTASAKREVVTSVINNKGKIEANSIDSLLGAPRQSGNVTIHSNGGTFKNEKGAEINVKTLDSDTFGGRVEIVATGDIEQNGTIDVTHEDGVNSSVAFLSEEGSIYGSEDGLIIAHKATLSAISTTAGGVGLFEYITNSDGDLEVTVKPLYTDVESLTVNTQSMRIEGSPSTGNIAISNVSAEDLIINLDTIYDIDYQSANNQLPAAHVDIETQGAITAGTIKALSASIKTKTGLNLETELRILDVDNFNTGNIHIQNHVDILTLGNIYARDNGIIFNVSDTSDGKTGSINIKQEGSLILSGNISAAANVTLSSVSSNIVNADAFDNQFKHAITSNVIYLEAAGAVGAINFEINVEIGKGDHLYKDHGLNVISGSVDIPSGDGVVTHSGVAFNSSEDLWLASLKLTGDDTDIYLNSENGNILIKNDITCTGDAIFRAGKGSIVTDFDRVVTAKKSLTMSALGSIGAEDVQLHVDTASIVAKSVEGSIFVINDSAGTEDLLVSAIAKQHILIRNDSESGNLVIEQINADGNALLSANGDILLSGSAFDQTPAVLATFIDFISHQGNIGSKDTPIIVAVHAQADDPLIGINASSAGSVYINNMGDDDFTFSSTAKDAFITSSSSILMGAVNVDLLDITSSHDIYTLGKDSITADSLIVKANSFGSKGEVQGMSLICKEIDITTYLGDCNIIAIKEAMRINNIDAQGEVSVNAFVDMTLVHINSYSHDTTIECTETLTVATIPKSSYHIEANTAYVFASNLIYENQSDPRLYTNSNHLHLRTGVNSKEYRITSTGNIVMHFPAFANHKDTVYDIVGKSIFIADNGGESVVFDSGLSFNFHATDGNIVFLNPNDTIIFTGDYDTAVDFVAEGFTSLTGMMILGNILTEGQDIRLEAKSHISLGQLNTSYNNPSTLGDVYITSHYGAILDNNGTDENIVARNVVLNSHAKDYEQLLVAHGALESYYSSLQLSLNSAQVSMKLADYEFQAANESYTLITDYLKERTLYSNQLADELNALYTDFKEKYAEYLGIDAEQEDYEIGFIVERGVYDILNMVPEIGPILAGGLDIITLFLQTTVQEEHDAALAAMQAAQTKYQQHLTARNLVLEEIKSAELTRESNAASSSKKYIAKLEMEQLVDRITVEQAATKQLLNLSQLASSSQAAVGSSSNSLDVRAENVTIHTTAASSAANSSVYINTVGDTGIKEITAVGINAGVYISSDDDIHLQGSIKADKDVILRSTAGAIRTDENSSIRATDLITLQAAGDVHVPKELTVTLSANPYAPPARDLIELISTGGSIIGDNISDSAAHGISARKLYAEAETGMTNLVTHVEIIEALTTTGGIEIEQMGDIVLELLSAPEGIVTFTATGGAITGTLLPHHDATVTAESLDIYAHGNIGEDDDHLLISVGLVSGAKSETGHIYMEDIDDLIVHQLSAAGNIYLNLAGSLNSANENSDVVGNHIHLNVGDELHPDTWDNMFDNHEEDHESIYLNGVLVGGKQSLTSGLLQEAATEASASPFMRFNTVLFPNSVYSDMGLDLLYRNSKQHTLIILPKKFIKQGFKKEKDIWLFNHVGH